MMQYHCNGAFVMLSLRHFTWLCLLLAASCHAAVTLRYPRLATANDPQQQYMLALLRLACEKANADCKLQAANPMVQSRAILQLQRPHSSIDVLWTMTSKERERQLLPVRIPLYKGLIGWRVALLGEGREQLLADVKTVDDLRAYSAGQGHDWPDVNILRAAGLSVVTSSDYEPLFSMLNQQRFDYFPRGVIEVENEYLAHRRSGITIDPHILIHYPTAFYFFVAPGNKALAGMLETGLERAIADGSFERLFRQFNAGALRRLQLDKRVIIRLGNPLLPAATPLQRKALWYSP